MTKRIHSRILDDICERDGDRFVFQSGVTYTRQEIEALAKSQSEDFVAHAENVKAIHKVKKHFNGEIIP